MTVNLPRASRLPATNFSTSNASPVASRLFSLSDTSPRQKSEERISVGRKCLRANVDFPAPEGPIRMTRQSSGMVSFTTGGVDALRRQGDIPVHRGTARTYRAKSAELLGAFRSSQHDDGATSHSRDTLRDAVLSPAEPCMRSVRARHRITPAPQSGGRCGSEHPCR